MAGGATALCVTGWGEAAVKACAGLPRHDPWLNKCPRVELLRLRAAEARLSSAPYKAVWWLSTALRGQYEVVPDVATGAV